MDKGKKALEALSEARQGLVLRYPLFGYLSMRFNLIEDPLGGGGGTCGVDAEGNFFYNPEFILGLNLRERVVVFAHEILHIVQACHSRRPMGANPALWNVASDYVVNGMIKESKLPTDPTECPVFEQVYPDRIYEAYKGMSSEEIFYKLLKNSEDAPKPGKKIGGLGGEGEDESASHERNSLGCCAGSSEKLDKQMEKTSVRRKWEETLIQAANYADQRGDTPGWLSKFRADICKPKKSWKDELRYAARGAFRNKYTWDRPSRRSIALGVRLQSRLPAAKGATIVIDTSGSISDKSLNQFLSECTQILRQCGAPYINIYFHDYEFYKKEKFDRNRTKASFEVQRGGTSHVDVLNKVRENEDDALVICFTDLESSFPDPKTIRGKTIWAVPENKKNRQHPWGVKICIKGLKN